MVEQAFGEIFAYVISHHYRCERGEEFAKYYAVYDGVPVIAVSKRYGTIRELIINKHVFQAKFRKKYKEVKLIY